MPVRVIVLMVAAIVFLYMLFTVGAPFLLALVAAIFLEPLILLLTEKTRMNRLAASTVSSTLFTVVLLGSLGLIGMKLVGELRAFLDKLPEVLDNANVYIGEWIERAQSFTADGSAPLPNQLEDWVSSITAAIGQLSTKLSAVLFGFATGIPDFFIFFVVFLVAVYLFSLSLPTIKSSFLSLFEEKSKLQVEEVLGSLRRSVFGFLRAQLLLSAITYVLAFTGLLIIGTGYPLAIALVIVIVDILPVLGVGTALVPWAVYQILTGEAYTGIGLIFLFLLITVVRRIVEPKILGDAVGISALAALISLYVGYKLIGVAGVFLGPIVVIVFMAMRKAGLFDFKIKFQ
ncbi:sporulation integral membrane protein YtvI [Paenibacillaceae bacterium WGS1546]|uniref:sporulation integral membrane protein YtvI n=1 Tax=Cohnella sp. WGS1546 TaxID=3366810 RepID=UPI00372D11C3